ncbi:MAG: CDP-glucose 4,6-dehydratase [Candidatus Riflebacteria bacterium]|nr:CDP-glucose 4,6-dehydratase [Candidatus Riflebacteria bacterium]
MNVNFWKNKRVFLTGHTGFKGSWLSLWLSSLGSKVMGYSLEAPSNPNLFKIARISDLIESKHGNIEDFESLNSAIASFKPEIVIHLAAQSLVRTSYDSPISTLSTNIIGTANVFEAVRKSGQSVRVIVNVTTDKCYENHEWCWGYRENDQLGGFDPYSVSKACSELITRCWERSFFPQKKDNSYSTALASARAGNVIGGGDWGKNRLFPDIFRAIENKSLIELRNPDSIRPWQFVLEPLYGYLLLAENLWNQPEKFIGAWNFGPLDSASKSVRYMVERFLELTNIGAEVKIHPSPLHEANILRLDWSKARTALKWNPVCTLDQTLSLIAEWFTSYQKNEDMQKKTFQQIEKYQEKISDVTS